MSNSTRWSLVPAVLAAFLNGGGADADDRHWECPKGGSFTELECWFEGFVPGPDDAAFFDLDAVYEVQLDDPGVFTDRLVILDGAVTLAASGGGYGLLNPSFDAPALSVGSEAGAVLELIGGPFAGDFLSIATDPGTSGELFMVDGVAVPYSMLSAALRLEIARFGDGTLHAGGHAELDAWTMVLAQGAGSTATAVFEDDALVTVDQLLTVGLGGEATMIITGSASVTCGDAIIAQQFGGSGTATVSGTNAGWTIEEDLDVGLRGTGVLAVVGGGQVNVGGFAALGTFAEFIPEGASSDGELRVFDEGSLLAVGGDLWVGFAGEARLVAGTGGQVLVGGSLLRPGGGTMTLVLGSSTDYADEAAVVVTGFSDPIVVTVELEGGFVPSAGDAFGVLEVQGEMGTVGFGLPALPAGLQWVVSPFDHAVVLEVVEGDAADVNGDGAVDVDDLVMVILEWGPCAPPPADCPADVDGDGDVDVDDLIAVILTWTR